MNLADLTILIVSTVTTCQWGKVDTYTMHKSYAFAPLKYGGCAWSGGTGLLNPALGNIRQGDQKKFKINRGYITRD